MTPIFHRLVSCHTTVLAADGGGNVASVSPTARPRGFMALLAFRPHAETRAWFLMAPELRAGRSLSFGHERGFGGVFPAPCNETSTALFLEGSGLFLTIAPLDPKTGMGMAGFLAAVPRGYEAVSFRPLTNPEIPRAALTWADLLTRICNPNPDPRLLAEVILREGLDAKAAPALDAAASLMSMEELTQLAKILLAGDLSALGALRAIYPHDISAEYALPEMMDWLARAKRDRALPAPAAKPGLLWRLFGKKALAAPAPEPFTPSPIRRIGTGLDRLDEEGIHGAFVSLPFACNVLWRRMATPRKRACVVATARNEGLYLLEWVAHHKALGFDHLFIYSNDNTDGSDDLLRALAEAGEITWIDSAVSPGRRAQWKAYGHALRVMPDTLDYEWALFIDIDEFFVLEPAVFASVGDFLDEHEKRDVDAIALNWMIVGGNSQSHWRDDLVSRRFPIGQPEPNPHVKSLSRPSRFIHSFPHEPATFRNEVWVFRNSRGALHAYDPARGRALALNPDFSTARVVHYLFKSGEEFLWKAARNRGDHFMSKTLALDGLEAGLLGSFVSILDEPGAPTGMAPWSREVEERVAALMALPGVGEAAAACKSAFFQQMPRILRLAEDHAVIRDLGTAGQQFLRTVRRGELSLQS